MSSLGGRLSLEVPSRQADTLLPPDVLIMLSHFLQIDDCQYSDRHKSFLHSRRDFCSISRRCHVFLPSAGTAAVSAPLISNLRVLYIIKTGTVHAVRPEYQF